MGQNWSKSTIFQKLGLCRKSHIPKVAWACVKKLACRKSHIPKVAWACVKKTYILWPHLNFDQVLTEIDLTLIIIGEKTRNFL